MVQSLSGLDAAFLYLETASTPLHVAQVCVFDPSTSSEGYSFDRVRALFESRLDRLAPFRRRLVVTPLGLGRPLWIEDPDFDLDLHLQPARLPAPGRSEELAALTGDFISTPLERSRPLWDMRVVEGLEGGMVAGVTKVHHAAIDGVSGAELTANLLDLEPSPPPDLPPAAWTPDAAPSPVQLLRHAGRSWRNQAGAGARAAGAAAGAARRVWRLNRSSTAPVPPSPFRAPQTPFNAPVGPRRHVGFAHLDLGDVTSVKDAAGATVNEVVLAVCAGALRSYLDELAEPPDRDLVAAVPVSVRPGDAAGAMGNRLSAMLVGLATTVSDPRRRLTEIVAGSRRSKEQDRAIGPETLSLLAEAVPPLAGPLLGRLVDSLPVAQPPWPLFNVMISNFPGPPFPLYCAGARLVAPYPIGPLFGGVALNITLQSYVDALHVGVVTDPDAVPHGDRLPGLLQEALDELVKVHS